MVQCPIAVLQPRQQCPVIEVPPPSPFQLSATGEPLSTGTVWAGSPHDVDAKPTSSERPRRPHSPRRRPRSAPPTVGLPVPCGPPVPLSPRLGEAGSTSEKSSGAPLSKKRTNSPERASLEQRARSMEPPTVPCSRASSSLEQLAGSVWDLILPASPPLEQARSSNSSLTVPPLPQGPRPEDIPVPETPPSGAPLPVCENSQLGGTPAPPRKTDLTVAGPKGSQLRKKTMTMSLFHLGRPISPWQV